PPPKADLSSGFTKIKEPIPKFDAAVGNFPFIRQELIEKTFKGYKDTLEKVIKEDWLADYRDAFTIKVSGQADIYAYLFFHTGRFVKEGGRMGFITSNAWLDVAYGYELQKYMVNNFKIVAILESRCEPWFEDAAVNTVVTILERCSDKTERDDHIVKFVKVKKKLAELIPWNAKLDAANRWVGLDGLVQKVENAGIAYLKIEGAKVTNTLEGVETSEDADFRIRLVRQSELQDKLNAEGKTAKWGQYLRAPQVYFDLLKEQGDRLIPLREVATIRRGFTTGINDFFYLTEETIKHWGIEEEFLAPIVKSPRELTRIVIDSENTKYKLFICHLSKAELRKKHKLGALKYIENGEKQSTQEGVNWSKVPTVSGRKQWYSISDRNISDLIIIAFFGERIFFPINKANVYVSDVLFEGSVKPSIDKDIVSAWLNTSINALFIQVFGRATLGEGVLKFIGPEIDQLLVIANPIETPLRTKIVSSFEKLAQRPVKSIFEEVNRKDRHKLDSLVLEAMGLDPTKYLQPIYDGLTEMVRERIELAGMRKKLNKAKPVRDITKLLEQVMKDLLQEGIKSFPANFFNKKPKPQDCISVPVADVPLRLGDYFFGQQEVAGDGFSYQAPSIAAAKYIIYAHKPAEYIVSLPNDEIIITKAITDYENYLKELFQKLSQELLNRTFDHKQAETLSRRIFQELGLPSSNL
ncbi:MAG: hypothetical protein V1932_03660, partial [Chloroflexota bacterium]